MEAFRGFANKATSWSVTLRTWYLILASVLRLMLSPTMLCIKSGTDLFSAKQLVGRRHLTLCPPLPFANFSQRRARRSQVSRMLAVASLEPDGGEAHPGLSFRVDVGCVFGHHAA